MRLKAPVGTRIEETEPMVLEALALIRKTVGQENVEITSDYMGVQPSSYPVNLIHLFTSGPEEALVQVQLRRGHPDDERLRESLRSAFQQQMPNLKMSFEAGDIVSQVMSFGSPTPVQIDVQGVDLDQDYAYLGKVEAELHQAGFLARYLDRSVSVVPDCGRKDRSGLRRPIWADDGGCEHFSCAGDRVPRGSLLPTTGVIRGPATPFRSRYNSHPTAFRGWARFLRSR